MCGEKKKKKRVVWARDKTTEEEEEDREGNKEVLQSRAQTNGYFVHRIFVDVCVLLYVCACIICRKKILKTSN